MPIYVYACSRCAKRFEVLASLQEAAPARGPGCDQPAGTFEACPLTRQMSAVAAHVKGGRRGAAALATPGLAEVQTRLAAASAMTAGAAGALAGLATDGARATPERDERHVCTKYCDRHGK